MQYLENAICMANGKLGDITLPSLTPNSPSVTADRWKFLRNLKIDNPAIGFELARAGLLGPQYPKWLYPEFELLKVKPERVWMQELRFTGDRRRYVKTGVERVDIPKVVEEWGKKGTHPSNIKVEQDWPNHLKILTGDLAFDDQGYRLMYSHSQTPRRELFSQRLEYASGLKAQMLLRGYLSGLSFELLQQLRDTYPGAVLEFTTFDEDLPMARGYNTLFFEVRHY